MKTDIQIAQEAKMEHIKDVAARAGIEENELEFYGKYKAKLSDELWEKIKDREDGKLVLVTAINPTPAGEGKTTTSVGLGQAMAKLNKNAIIAIVVVSWTKYARLARSLVMKIRDRDYVSAAIVTGSKTPYMLFRYMLPNALPTLIITAATDIGSMILELAAMSFLGFGAKPPAPEWGYMLNEGRACMQSAPWLLIFPGLAIFVVVVVFNMLGDSIRDILDPRNE